MSGESESNWYYTVELENGTFTEGSRFSNLALTRRLLRNVDCRKMTAIDIGTQEAVIPILLKKGGTEKVVAYDRFDKSASIERLKKVYGVDFDYLCGIQLDDLPRALDRAGNRLFDLVVFSGVLYHMINPLGHLVSMIKCLERIQESTTMSRR